MAGRAAHLEAVGQPSANSLPLYTSGMDQERLARISKLAERLHALTDSQLHWVEEIVQQFSTRSKFILNESNLFDDCMIRSFGDALLVQHCFSKQPMTKDRFEYVLEAVSNICGHTAALAGRGLRGPDITIEGETYSLKTQAERSIREDEIHISKFMELGKGKWGTDPSDLVGLRDQFLEHLKFYDRILCLRALSTPPSDWRYELVEIPKSLLAQASGGALEMMIESPQLPRPGYCHVKDDKGAIKFQLYFDGGSERKLQVRHLRKSLCRVHATWQFPAPALDSQPDV